METESTLDVSTVPLAPQEAPHEAPPDVADGEVYVFPASFAQQRLWFLDRLEPDSPAYNLYNAVRLVGDLRGDMLARTMEEIVARHETLRTTFATLQGEPVQVISPAVEVRMPLFDLAGLPAGRRDEELAALSTAEARRPFDLARGPLLRVTLVRLAATEHAVLLNLHHIVGDGWSMGILVREVAALYTAFARGEASPLPDLPLQYADFAQAQREWLQGEVLAEQIAYWRRQLAGLAPLDLPADHPRPAVRSARSGVRGTLVPAATAAPLADLARRRGTTLFVALLAAVQTLLHRYTGGDDVAVGTVTAGRSHVDSEGMIGFFVNTLVMRTGLSGAPSFGDLLDRAHSAAMGAFAHQDLPFERLVEELQPQRDLSRSPFFDVLLVLQNLPPRSFELPGLQLLPAPGGAGVALFDWTLTAVETDGGLVLSLAYNADLFEAPTAERALAHLAVLVEEAGAAPRTALSDLPLLSPAERAQLVREWNDTAVARPGGLFLHGLVADRAARSPDAVAVTFEGESLTWGELQLQAGRLARRLRALGCGPEVRVGVAMERSPELVVALLGTLAAGAAYVPLDSDHPRERLALMIEDARPAVIVAQERLLSRLPETQVPVVLLDGPLTPDPEAGEPLAADGATRCSDLQLAYVIFTSGSTGRPKASMLHHRGIVNRLLWMREVYGVGPSDAVLQKTPFGFDVSVWELFVPLITGARLVMARPGGHRESSYQVELVGREGVSVLHFVPSMLRLFLDEPDLSPCGSLRLVVASGEALSPDLVRRFRERLAGPALENLYGPTEASVEVTAWSCGEDAAAVPIGRPIANAGIHLVDRGWQPVPIGVPGELWIAGVPVARGYLGRPDLTAERFVPNPFSPAPGARAYRSGDLARHRADGAVEFLGRVDQQVKIRGFRVEPGEVEAALLAHPAVGQAAVVARSGAGGASLVAYVAPRVGAGGLPDPSALRDFLRQGLPEPMVPARFVRLPVLPLNASGKLDRRALPEIVSEMGEAATGAPVPPRDPVEEGILAIWREVLGIDGAGVHDVFFELGGHSLSATRVVSRVRAAFGIDLPLRALFEAPTVAGLGERVRAALRHGAGVVAPPLVADPVETGGAPLSFAQQRLWFLHRLEPGSTVYNLRTGIRLPDDLDLAVLARGVGEVVRRHATLRTRFAEVDGEPVQVIEPAVPPAAFVLPLTDLAGLGTSARAQAQRLAEELGDRPFDLALEPPVRWLALRLPGDSGGAPGFALLVVMHHVVSDAWSMGILARELSALYAAFRRGLSSPLPPLPVQYADFARWQRRWLSGDVLAGELAWWRERLAGLPARLDLPADRPRLPVQSQRGAIRELWVTPELGARVAALALREGATPFMVLLTTYQGLLARWSGQDDFAVGTPIAGRTRVEVEELIGFFINNLVLRASLGGEPGFREVLGQVRSATLDAYAHQDLPFEKLVEELAPERSLAHSPIFQVVFGLQTAPTGTPDAPEATVAAGAGGGSPLELASRTAKYDLLLSLFHEGEGFAGIAEYSTDLFDAITVDRFLGHFRILLAAVLEDPGRRLADIPLLAGAERHQTLVEWSGPVTPYPREATVQALFEEQADHRPDAVAVIAPAGGVVAALTYGELEARANRLAHHLRAWGVGPEVLVGLCLERSADLLVGILGILKAGGAYVPLDPSYPLERLAWLLDNTFMPVVVAEERTADLLPAGPLTRLVLLDGDAEALRAESDARPDSAVLPDNLVYVLYTSGSTGEPKGVAAVHRGVVRLVRETGYARFGSGEVFLQLAPVSFDASTLEIWGPLLNGGRLVVPPPGTVSLAELGALLADHDVTTLWLTAGLFHEMADAHLAGLAPVRQLLAGGDVLSPVHAGRVLSELSGLRLINGYGPTENTTFTCCHPMADPADVGRSVAIGRPIANTSVYLLDRRSLPVPLGVHGELAAGGDGLARGYLDRPDLTAERWLPDAASGLAGGRLYHTGDLARLLPDGRIEFLGRIDQQVKIRGFRIEPGEIEAALAHHPAVRESVVVAREDRPGDRRLVAYVVADPEGGGEEGAGGERELRSYLAERLPGHMVPAHVVFLEALPLTANGKVDRRALPVPGSEGGAAAGFVAPAGEVEEALAAIWSEVLARSPIGAQDNFFELGGHSLLAVRVISQVRDRFGVELPLRTLFEEPTVAGMARALEAGSRGTAAAPEAPPLRALLRNLRPGHEEVFPLSFAQQRLWFLDRLEPGSPLYNMPLVLRLEGRLEADVLERAIAWIVQRHESLRTTFRMGAGGSEPVQVVAPPRGFTLPVIDLAAAGAALPDEVRRLVMEDALLPFDLERGPLFRPRLLRLGAEDHVILASMHHIVSDGWSLSVLVRELVTLYGAFREGVPSPLPELPVQYVDYSVWQRGWLSGEVLEAELEWWRQRLAGLPPLLDLPTDRPRPAVQTYAGTSRPVRLEGEPAAALSALAVGAGATLFMVVLALFQALLSRWAGQDDFALGSPVAGRNRSELEGLVGFFVNTLVLRSDLAGRPGFHELLERTRQRTLEVYTHQEVPFEKLVEELRPQRSLAHPPLFQVVFALQNMPRGDFELPGLRLTSMGWGENRTAKFDLTLFLTEMEEGLAGTLEYNTDLFDAATVDRLAGHLQRLAAAALEAPDTPVAELSFLSAEETAQLLVEWNATRRDYPRYRLLPELFAEQAALRPDAVALVAGSAGDERITYGGLELRALRLAGQLRDLGVGPDIPVALFAERSLSTITGLLAISLAGGAYVPLDPQHPAERLAFLLDDVRPAAVLTEAELIGRLPAVTAHLVPLDGGGEDYGSSLRGAAAPPDSLACVLYTSGSTGRPKGVEVTHRNVARLVRGGGFADLGPGQVFLQLAPLAFDASTLEVWGALANGGQLVIPAAGPVSLRSLVETLERDGVTTLWLTAGLFHQMVDENPEGLRPVRQLLAGGDVLSPPHVRRALAALPESVLINGYGPTENTTFTCCHVLRRGESLEPSVPIGRPIGNTRVHLLDEGLAPVPAGVRGELFAGGDGVARGYFGQPALTAERFVPDPFDATGGGRLYRTGDLARWRPDGILEFLGRIDQQVKLRGFRVEPGEVEAVLAEHPAVRQAAVLVRREEGGEKRLVGYVAGRVDVQELRRYLERLLPAYMVPAGLMVLEELPLNPSGKVDRLALSRMAAETADVGLFVAPRGPLEEMLAAVWSEVLGRERIGARDDFFALGGHSLLATRVISRVRSVFGVDLPVASLFEAPTPAGLAARIAAALSTGEAEGEGAMAPRIVPVPREGRPPLSFAQERLWFLDQLEPGLATYNMPFSVRLTGAFDLAALAAGLAEVVRRHEALRTTFPAFEGAPWQRVAPFSPPPLPAVDLRGLPREPRDAETRAWLAREATRPFDLARGPLLRPLALLTADDELVLFLALHHAVSDGWSMGILEAELGALYAAFSRRLPSPLSELPVQYVDFAVWQRRWLTGEVLERQLGYWRRTLAGTPALLELPADRPRPPVQSFRGATLPFSLPAELARALQALARRHGATLFMTVLSAFQALLHRATGQDVIPVGTPVANRHHHEIEGLIGFFANTLVLPADLGDAPPFNELLARVRQTSLAAHAHQDLPFEKLVEELAPERSLGHSPLFQVMLTFQNLPFQGPAAVPAGSLAGLAASGVETSLGIAKFDLDLALVESGEGLDGSLTYATDLFDEPTAVRLLQQLETLLSAVTARPELRPSELLLLSEAQRQQLLLEWSGRERVEPIRCLHHFVEAQADRTPEAVAVRFGDDLLTYGALEEQANRLACLLRRQGVGPEVPVAVFMDRSLEMVVALLGVLKAGGAYVPLDPVYPRERLAFMLEDCQAPVLLSQDWLVERLPEEGSSRRITLDPSFEVLEDEDDERPEVPDRPVTPANLAYVIYTSGSTGRPKGVAITHGSSAALLEWAAAAFGEDELAGTLASTSICFDLSVFELFVPLSRGGCVLLVESALDLLEIGGEVGGQPVTLINTVPSAAAELVRAAGLPASVRTVNLAGEPIPPALAAQLHAQPGVRRLLNLYGPSEDTTYSTMETVLPGLVPPAIGRPLAGTRAYVLDRALQPVPPGMPGELYLGGAGLARGYFRRPDLTAERFVPDRFSTTAEGAGRRLYRTGDRVRHLADGRLDFLGRIDHQVKLRGYRMELGEIEAALSLHPGVRQAVVGVRESGRDRRLVAWFVPAAPAGEGNAPGIQELRAFLAERLPHYMVPSALVALAALPLTPTGKIDRRALPDPAVDSGLAPRNVTELELARLWEEVLGVGPVGVRDDFFQLGGHSLLAVRLMALVRERFGRDLPLASLFRAPSIERLALLLRQEGESGERQALVEITPQRPLPADAGAVARPFFCVHPAGGNVLCYLDLARALGPDQPFYGLQLPTTPALRSVEEMAAHYLAAIRDVQPAGPYLLGGWSIGGIVAFEMAQQLTAAGEEVALLAVVDSVLVIREEDPLASDELAMISLFAQDLAFTYGQEFVVSMSVAELRSLDPAVRLQRVLAEAQQAHLLPPGISPAEAERLFTMYRDTRKAMAAYVPRPYPGPVVSFIASEGADRERGDENSAAGWENVAGGGVEVETIAGDHYSILRPPMVAEVAARLAARIQALGGSEPR